jgi:asparagine synthase (glutamine-hydrolysing)
MCGIVGIYGPGGICSDLLAPMLKQIVHRGPDGEGVYADPTQRCALGQRRLAIIDPEGGHQPMANEDETVWITFNGCIYNYQDIGRLLRQKGHRFRSHCDTEVIIHAYEEWGPECVQHFNGMWAFAIWDERNGTLFCSRDRLGVKPFYYCWDGSVFVFGSEIKALLASGRVGAAPDTDGLRQYLTFQFCLGDQTMFRDVKKLPPGHNLVLRLGQDPEIAEYWDLRFQIDQEHDESYFTERLYFLLEDSVRLRLRSDVPLGAHLSGGVDSSSVVALSRLLLGDVPLKTFTGAFPDGRAYDETQYAKLASAAANTEYHEIYLTADDFARSIEKIVWYMDEPAAGPGVFPQYWVSKLAAEHVKVVLGGQGGDELFIGYARYLVAYLEECLRGAIEHTADRSQYVATLATIVPSLPSLENYMPMLKQFWQQGLFDEPTSRYFALMDRFADSQAYLSPEFPADRSRTYEEFRSVFLGAGAASLINRILYFDVKTHLQSLLHVEDRTSMAWGLESRVPLLDYRLVEFVASVPPVAKFRNGQLKYLFRQAVRNLVPREILDRKDKMGFPVPFTTWVNGELRDFIRDILLSPSCRGRGVLNVSAIEASLESQQPFGRALWGALCLELWYRQFIDGPGAPTGLAV